MFAALCQESLLLEAHSESLVMCISQALFRSHSNASRADSKSPISPITVFEILRLVWTIWYVYNPIWRAKLCLCRFQFLRLQRPGSVPLVHGFTHDKSVPFLFSTPLARSQQQTAILILLLKKVALVNGISSVLYLVDPMWIFSPRIWEELQF